MVILYQFIYLTNLSICACQFPCLSISVCLCLSIYKSIHLYILKRGMLRRQPSRGSSNYVLGLTVCIMSSTVHSLPGWTQRQLLDGKYLIFVSMYISKYFLSYLHVYIHLLISRILRCGSFLDLIFL